MGNLLHSSSRKGMKAELKQAEGDHAVVQGSPKVGTSDAKSQPAPLQAALGLVHHLPFLLLRWRYRPDMPERQSSPD